MGETRFHCYQRGRTIYSSMSALQSIADIKIPYASEGVIRTAQLDDTVCSKQFEVQLAVNMNFDRVGAIITRPGVTEYADDLDDPITNYGTLSNDVTTAGYAVLQVLGSISDMGFGGNWISFTKIDSTTVIMFLYRK